MEKTNNFNQIISNLTDEQKLFVATIYSTLESKGETEENSEIDDNVVNYLYYLLNLAFPKL